MAEIPRRFRSIANVWYMLVTTAIISLVIFHLHCKRPWVKHKQEVNAPFKTLKHVEANGMKVKSVMEVKNVLANHIDVMGRKTRKVWAKITSKTVFLKKPFLINITVDRFTGKMFNVLSNENDFTPENLASTIPKLESHDMIHHKFLLSGKIICSRPAPFLLIIIPSVVEHYDLRQAIRKTWMKAALSNHWPGYTIKSTVYYLFFLGNREKFNRTNVRKLSNEYALYQDTVVSSVVDSYRNLSRKMVSALQWVHRYCNKAQYIMKSDEDTFINVPLLVKVISLIAQETEIKHFVLGRAHNSVRPAVVRTGRWAVSAQDYPFKVFPRYLYGHSYVFSGASIPRLLSAVYQTNLIPPEDAYLTGILSKFANVTRIDVPSFAACGTDLYDCGILHNRYVSMTAVKSPSDHHRLWKSVVDKKCHPKIAFNHKMRHPNVKPVTYS